jgi:hypothetical protein
MSVELRDVAAGQCPQQPFLIRPAHTYLIHCQVTLLPGVAGTVALTDRDPIHGTFTSSFNLTDPAKSSAVPSPSGSTRLPADFPEAAGVPEAEDVAGVSVGPVSEQDDTARRRAGLFEPPEITAYSASKPAPGEPLFFTVKYVVTQRSPEVEVMSYKFLGGVTAGKCPGPFLIRPVHTYLLRCQAALRPGVGAALRIDLRSAGQAGGGILVGINCSQCPRFDPAAQDPTAASSPS